MSELRKANTDAPYFITCTVVGWIDVFTRSRYNEILIDSLIHCQKHKGMEIFAYVIMSNHMHIVARNLDSRLNHILRDFKSFTAKKILDMIENEPGESRKEWLMHMFAYYAKFKTQNREYQFWQKTNHPIELHDSYMIDQKIDYIHNNPVAAGVVTDPEFWHYSSANPNSKIQLAPL